MLYLPNVVPTRDSTALLSSPEISLGHGRSISPAAESRDGLPTTASRSHEFAKNPLRIARGVGRSLDVSGHESRRYQERTDMTFTNRFTKSFAASVFAAGTLGIGAIVGAGIANADAVDDTFVVSLAQAGIPQIDPALEITAGHAVCLNLDQGATPDQLVAAFNRKRVFATNEQNRAMIVASMTAYCPQYLPQLHA